MAVKTKIDEAPLKATKEKEKKLKENKRKEETKKQNEKRTKQDYEMRKFCDLFDFEHVGTHQPSFNSNGLWEVGGAVEEWKLELENFGFADVARGIVPAAVQKLLEACRVRKSTARSMVLAAWKEAGIGVKEMWKQRCEITVAWEEDHGIRQTAKEGKGKGRKGTSEQQVRDSDNVNGQDQARTKPPNHRADKRPKHSRKSTHTASYGTCPRCQGPTGELAHEPWEHTPAYLARCCASSIWSADRIGICKIPPGFTTLAKKYIAAYELQTEKVPTGKRANAEPPHTSKHQPHNAQDHQPPTVPSASMKGRINNKHSHPRNTHVPQTTNNATSYHLMGARQHARQIKKQQPLQGRKMTSTHTPHQGVHAGRSFFVNNLSSDPPPLG